MQSIKDEYVPAKKARLKQEVEAAGGAHMAIVQVGHVESSDRYVRNKIKDCDLPSVMSPEQVELIYDFIEFE